MLEENAVCLMLQACSLACEGTGGAGRRWGTAETIHLGKPTLIEEHCMSPL